MRAWLCFLLGVSLTGVSGCAPRHARPEGPTLHGGAAFLGAPQEIEYASVSAPNEPLARDVPAPWTLRSEQPPEYWELPLEEAIRLAMSRSQIVRDLGGRVIESPVTSATRSGPALQEADPRSGAVHDRIVLWPRRAHF